MRYPSRSELSPNHFRVLPRHIIGWQTKVPNRMLTRERAPCFERDTTRTTSETHLVGSDEMGPLVRLVPQAGRTREGHPTFYSVGYSGEFRFIYVFPMGDRLVKLSRASKLLEPGFVQRKLGLNGCILSTVRRNIHKHPARLEAGDG